MAAFISRSSLLQRNAYLCTPWTHQHRLYALSRFPHRTTGFGRNSRGSVSRRSQPDSGKAEGDPLQTSPGYEEAPFVDRSHFWKEGSHSPAESEAGLRRLLMNDELVVTRQLEMLNIFMGFEQANRYVITNQHGESLGYIAEERRGFLSMFSRQVFRTHRPFRALVMDLDGSPILWIRRPFSWINSRMFVQRPVDHLVSATDQELVLDTFAEVQQEWHIWRRRYNLFLRITFLDSGYGRFRSILANIPESRSTHRALTLGSDLETQPATREAQFQQFARVDEGLWAWYFILRDAQGDSIASVNRAFRGFGREIFTDTGQYNISFRAPDEQVPSSSLNGRLILRKPGVTRSLTIDEKALILATAINIDYDYFSRHSEGGHRFGFWWSSGE